MIRWIEIILANLNPSFSSGFRFWLGMNKRSHEKLVRGQSTDKNILAKHLKLSWSLNVFDMKAKVMIFHGKVSLRTWLYLTYWLFSGLHFTSLARRLIVIPLLWYPGWDLHFLPTRFSSNQSFCAKTWGTLLLQGKYWKYPRGVLVPPFKVTLCFHVPTIFPYLFPA